MLWHHMAAMGPCPPGSVWVWATLVCAWLLPHYVLLVALPHVTRPFCEWVCECWGLDTGFLRSALGRPWEHVYRSCAGEQSCLVEVCVASVQGVWSPCCPWSGQVWAPAVKVSAALGGVYSSSPSSPTSCQ